MHYTSKANMCGHLCIEQAMAEQEEKPIYRNTSSLQIDRFDITRCSNKASYEVAPAHSCGFCKIPKSVGQIFRIVLLCMTVVAFLTACKKPANNKKEFIYKLTFALPVADWWTASPFIISQSDPFFKEKGLQLANLEVNSGLASKNAVVAGTADIGLSAATPLALAAARNEKLVILGTYLQSKAIIGLVGPSNMPTNVRPPEPVAIVPSTISESFLYQYLVRIGEQQLMEKKQLNELHLRPADIPGSLRNGSARSAVIWEPFLSFCLEQPGFIKNHLDIDFQVNLYLITRSAFLRAHPAEIEAFLEGVKKSCRYINDNQDEARRQVEGYFGFELDFLKSTWPNVKYGFAFDTSNMKAELLREAAIAKALGYISEVPSVDYLLAKAPSR